ncbi:MAG: alpha/beta hydrolase [Alistipes sp.]|nr:alpha/beta hydrolase [Alistipes sp.]
MRQILITTILLFAFCLPLQAQTEGQNASIGKKMETFHFATKDNQELYLDHHIAPIEGKRGCVIYVFGGGFSGGSRDRDRNYFEFLNRNGWDVVAIDYRLGMKDASSPGILEFFKLFEHTITMAVEDLYSATDFVVRHAEEWNIDKNLIVISGSSAGAITSLQAEYNINRKDQTTRLLPEGFRYAGVIAFAGAVFTLSGAPDWEERPAPMMLFHGNADTQVPYNKMALFGIGMYGSKYITDRLEQRGWPYWFYTIEYEDHSMASSPMRDNHTEIVQFLNDFVVQKKDRSVTTFVRNREIEKRKTWFLPTDFINSNYSD